MSKSNSGGKLAQRLCDEEEEEEEEDEEEEEEEDGGREHSGAM